MQKTILTLGLVFSLGSIGLAQKVDTKATSTISNQTSLSKKGVVNLESGTQIAAQLQNSIDVKKAKVGDQVVLKTTKAIKQNGQVIINKGATLTGRVTEVQQKTKANAVSKVGVVFESIQSGKMTLPLSATLVSITQIQSAASINDNAQADIYGSTSTGTSTRSSGGGLLGGVTNTVGSVVNTTATTVGGVTNSVGNTVGGTLKGIQVSQSSDTSVEGSSMLSLQGGNLRLEKGTNFNLRVTESTSINK